MSIKALFCTNNSRHITILTLNFEWERKSTIGIRASVTILNRSFGRSLDPKYTILNSITIILTNNDVNLIPHVCIKSQDAEPNTLLDRCVYSVRRSAVLFSKESKTHAQYSSNRAAACYTLYMRRKRLCLSPTYNLLQPPLASVVWRSATLVMCTLAILLFGPTPVRTSSLGGLT